MPGNILRKLDISSCVGSQRDSLTEHHGCNPSIASSSVDTHPPLWPRTPRIFVSFTTGPVRCFTDTQDLNGTMLVSGDLRPESCGTHCKAEGFPFFGLGWSKECSCGDAYGSLGRSYQVRASLSSSPWVAHILSVGSPAVLCLVQRRVGSAKICTIA